MDGDYSSRSKLFANGPVVCQCCPPPFLSRRHRLLPAGRRRHGPARELGRVLAETALQQLLSLPLTAAGLLTGRVDWSWNL
jgi:hypothetical protein